MYDVLADWADFEGVIVGRRPLDLLALYLAVAQFDCGVQDGGTIISHYDSEDDE